MDTHNKSQKIAEYCTQQILLQTKRPLFVAITGDSGSGKSYYSSEIRKFLENKHIAYTYVDFDDFLIPRENRMPLKSKFYKEGPFKGKSYWEILENWFFLEKFKRAINDLKNGNKARYFPYSRATGDLDAKEKVVKPENIILLDSSMFSEFMDFVILIEVNQETIIERKIERDKDLRTPEQVREMHEKVQGYYWQRTKPETADIIIDNSNRQNPFVIKG